jgi:ABC-type transport system substrate-binding protein
MRHSAWRLPALISLIGLAADAHAEIRPRYGGKLTVEIHEAITLTDPGEWPPQLVPLVYDRLVRLDDRGQPQPALAVSWQHDRENKRWEFRLREGAKFHDGTAVTAAAVAACFKNRTDATFNADGEKTLIVELRTQVPDLPERMTDARTVILRRGADGVTVGTGPFRIGEWQPGRRALLTANEEYWGGRPFLDSIELQMFRAYRDQSIDLELGKADVVELSIDDARRVAQRGIRTWSSAPSELMALVFEHGRPAAEDSRAREAVARSIDRDAIHNVLLQRQGEPAGALLPQWLTGYAFLFPATRDLDRARQIAAPVNGWGLRLTLSFDPSAALERPIAERIALNAREAGIAIQVVAGGKADIRLARVRLRSSRPAQALADVAAAFGIGEIEPTAAPPEALVEGEKKLLGDFRVVPLFHLPEILGLGGQVRNWDPELWSDWRLDSVWLEPRRP